MNSPSNFIIDSKREFSLDDIPQTTKVEPPFVLVLSESICISPSSKSSVLTAESSAILDPTMCSFLFLVSQILKTSSSITIHESPRLPLATQQALSTIKIGTLEHFDFVLPKSAFKNNEFVLAQFIPKLLPSMNSHKFGIYASLVKSSCLLV